MDAVESAGKLLERNRQFEEKELVVKQFYGFFHLISTIRDEIVTKHATRSPETEDYQQGQTYLQDIRGRLESILVSNYEEAHALDWGHGQDYYKEAQYVMAVFADEVFINLDWYGAREWQKELLEAQFFQTTNAGDLFFVKLDDLLEKHGQLYIGIAKVYFLALALGFRGKYHGVPNSEDIIANYKKKLFIFVYGGRYDYREITIPFFEEPYLYVAGRSKPRLLPF